MLLMRENPHLMPTRELTSAWLVCHPVLHRAALGQHGRW